MTLWLRLKTILPTTTCRDGREHGGRHEDTKFFLSTTNGEGI
jgi:hypothetical protein